jgi:transcription elongation factor Elf1
LALWCEEKYLRLLSPLLEQFKQRQQHTFNFRCPLCGDSERTRTKTRGYVFPKGDMLMFKCHNCGMALPFPALLKRVSPTLYNDFMMEKLKDSRPPVPSAPVMKMEPRMFVSTPAVCDLDKLTSIPDGHPLRSIRTYIKGRNVPDMALGRLSGTVKAYTWLLPLVGEEKAKKVKDDVPYLVLPFKLEDRSWFGCQLRAVNEKNYITFRWAQEPLKVFGLDSWTPKLPTYIVEGPIDSLFVPNTLAICGSDLWTGTQILEERGILSPDNKRVFIWDNEPRNLEVCRHIQNAIRMQESVVIWPSGFPKDINDMVLSGIDVMDTIQTHTFQGLKAELEFEAWKR